MHTRSLFSSQYYMWMIINTRSPRNRSLHQVRYYIAAVQHWRVKEKPQDPMHMSSPHHRGTLVTYRFHFWFWMIKSQILHVSSLKKNWDQVKERLTSTCIKQVISKPSDTVILYYLAFNAFYVGFFSERIFISCKIIIVNNFLWSWTGFELDIETYYFDSFLELSKMRPPEFSKNKTQNWILEAGEQFWVNF